MSDFPTPAQQVVGSNLREKGKKAYEHLYEIRAFSVALLAAAELEKDPEKAKWLNDRSNAIYKAAGEMDMLLRISGAHDINWP